MYLSRSVLKPASRLSAVVLLVLSLGLTARAIAGEALVLRNGERVEAPSFRFDGTSFHDAGAAGAAVARESIQDWWVAPSGDSRVTTARGPRIVRAALAPELVAYRDEAQRFAAQFPGCKGVQVLDDGLFRLTPDHRHVYRYHFVGLILNEDLLAWGTLNLGFTEGRQRVKVVTARTLTPEGRVLELDPAEITVSRPQRGDVFFDPNARQLNALLPGVQVGALVEYEFEYETLAPEDWRLFFPSFYFQGDVPVCRSRLTVQVPHRMPLYSWEDNWHADKPAGWQRRLKSLCPLRPFERGKRWIDGQAMDSYRWEKRAVPPIIPEPNMPPWSETAPAVHATLHRGWGYLDQLVGGMQRERMQATPEVRALAAQVTQGAQDLDGKLARLYHWVQKNIRYISIKSSLSSGWSGHPAAETLREGYGDCTDKSILFATLARTLGIEAEPVIVKTSDTGLFTPRYPVIFGNHCITELHLPRGTVFLDTTTQDHRYPALREDDHGVLALNLIRGERQIVPVPDAYAARGKISRAQIQVLADGTLRVQEKNQYSGAYEAGLRGGWKGVPEPQRGQILQQFLNRLAPGAHLETFSFPDPQDLNIPFTLDYQYVLPTFVSRAGRLRVLQVPDRELRFPEVSLERRRYPVVYGTREATRRELVFDLPADWEAVDLPGNTYTRGSGVSYREHFLLEGRRLTVRLEFERDGTRVPVTSYARYRHDLQQIEAITRKPLFFETRAPATPP